MCLDFIGMQIVLIYWVDVEENQKFEGVVINQYLFVIKYGGFMVFVGYSFYINIKVFFKDWWLMIIDIFIMSNVNMFCLDNFFEGGNVILMCNGLNVVFFVIVSVNVGSSVLFLLNLL